MKLYEELRDLTRVYMARHSMSQKRMAEALGVSQPTVRTWAFESAAGGTVLNEAAMEKLVDLLRQDKLVVARIGTARANTAHEKLKAKPPKRSAQGGRTLSAIEKL